MEHHWGRGLTALGFGLYWIRTLVSMATDSSHRVIISWAHPLERDILCWLIYNILFEITYLNRDITYYIST